MHILMLTQWFDPEPTFKGLLFAKALKGRGHEVTVVTGFPNYPGGAIYPGYKVRAAQREHIDGINVIRVPLYPSHNSSALQRIGNYLSFSLTASVASLLVSKPDIAYVYHPPGTMGLPASVLKWFRGVPFVYDIQDLWPDTLAATGMVSNPRVLQLVGWTMNRVYRSATQIVVLSTGFRDSLMARGVAERKISVIPNWADENQIDTREPERGRADSLGFAGRLTVTFAGNLGKVQNLETVLDAAERLRDLPAVRFLLIGTGTESDRLQSEAEARGLTNVDFMPRRPVHEIGEILSLSDVLLVHLKDDPLFAMTIPSKTQTYLLAGKPVLMGVRGNAADMVLEAGAGIVFEPESASSLESAVRSICAMTQDERKSMGIRGRAYYDQFLSVNVGTARFLDVLEEANLSRPRAMALKRSADVGGAAIGLALASAPMACIAGLVKWRLGSPVLFRQVRPGRYGEPFEMLKFRTMNDRRDLDQRPLPDRERLTKLGRFLRATSLDELPEFLNVLRGDMSLVGPRPLLSRYTPYFTDEESVRLTVRPGITGWAQVNGRNNSPWSERLANDAWYVRNRSTLLDFRILFLTIARMVRGRDVVTDPISVMQDLDDERRGTSQ